MSDDIVIRAEGLGKKYIIGHEVERERYVALRDVLARGARGLWRKAADMARGRIVVPGDTVEEFWALKDVSFEVKRGEVLGIIGRNGAGKSTLLKILSRITEPTKGRVTIHGRVASLLEVGTGFHPELTGRENIYLNGAVLGMTRGEIRRKFDEIVAFAEVEKFLDTPVKRYSSGMYVRLAFAVAAHLEPEILIVDEVLAVGDAEFQKKCLGKMQDVAGHGRTVLFVSHNMGAIRSLCSLALLLKDGRVGSEGNVENCIDSYASIFDATKNELVVRSDELDAPLEFVRVSVLPKDGGLITTFGSLVFEFFIRATAPVRSIGVAVHVFTRDGMLLSKFSNQPESDFPISLNAGDNHISLVISELSLSSGDFTASIGIARPNVEWLFFKERAVLFSVGESDVFNSGFPPNVRRFPVPMRHTWHNERIVCDDEVIGSVQNWASI